MESTILVSPAEAAATLWAFGAAGGVEPGGFVSLLLQTIQHADQTNRARLAMSFPGHVAAVQIATLEADGIEQLQAIAKAGR